MHKCIVAKIDRIEEIPGADKICTGYVLGEQVIISKDWSVGDVGLLFPEGLQLSEEFCKYNNLYRDSSKNRDNNKRGFFDNNRRVRTQPFMKVRSEAFFCEKSALVYCGENQHLDLQVGDQFDALNGFKVCQKYYSEQTLKKVNNIQKKKTKVNATPDFHKHVNTEQFKHYVNKINVGDLITIQAKAHGCFRENARVKMADRTVKKISQIEVGDKVRGYSNGVSVSTEVTNTFRNGTTEDWLEIFVDRPKYTPSGNSFYKVTCTPNHRINTPDGYVEAKELKEGSKVYVDSSSYMPSEDQIAAYIGMYLGDGYFSRSSNMQFCHKKDHEEYIDYKRNMFSSLKLIKKTDKVSGYGSNVVFTMLPSITYLKPYFEEAQKDKGVTDWMVENATPLTLAIIYMDDGSLSHNRQSYQRDRASIACCSISEEHIDNYERLFTKFDIHPVVYKDSRNFYRMRFNYKDAEKLWDLISPYIPECMKYKFPKDCKFKEFANIEQGEQRSFRVVGKVSRSNRLKKKGVKYDIETGTSNYVVSNVLVHNSSGRYSYTKVNLQLPKWKGLVNKAANWIFGNGVYSEWEYKYLVGTRNVVLHEDQYDKEGFHGIEQWRFNIIEELKPHLEKGMTVFGEICGYANGKPIMAVQDMEALKNKKYNKKYGKKITYTYNCKETEARWHIYRIQYINESGATVDLTDAQIKEWCLKRGFNATLDVHPPFIFDGDYEKLSSLVEELTERPDCLTEDYIDPSHISEGVIVRVDNGHQTPQFYKNKSYAFKVLEGIAKEVEPDLEDAS